ncbi:MAG: Rieske (2Fe-2S) protein [Sulfolobaceae archaeon]
MEIEIKGLKIGEKKKIIVDNKELLLIFLGSNKIIICDVKCPHLGCDLYKYGVLIREEIICQCHFSHFSIHDGKVRKGPAERPLRIYKYEYVDKDKIKIYI